MNDNIRAALVNVIRANRQKMSRYQRQKGIKPQRWLYPLATEKRYAATIRAWLRPMKDYVHSYLKENQAATLRGDSADGAELHLDSAEAENISVTRLDAVPGKSFKTMIDSLTGWLGQYVPTDNEAVSGSPIYMGLGKIADGVFDFNEGQFEKGAKSVLGVEFPVGEDWWPDTRDMWAYNNYQATSGSMYKYVHDINGLVEMAVTSGLPVRELSKQITALDEKLFKGRANFIARDQIGKLNGQITQMRMESVGLSMYIWETSGDERVRPSHQLIDGGLCRWDDSTVFSQDGGKTWIDRPAGTVNLHPGMDYQCRCCAIAYWEELIDEADVAIAQYEELDALAAQNIAATKPLTPKPKSGNISSIERLAKAQTLDDLADHAREEWGVKTVNLDGLDVNAIKGTFEAMETVLNKYPKLKKKIIEIGQSKAGIMSTGMKDDGFSLNFNPGYYKNIDDIKTVYDNGVLAGHYPKGTNWANAGVHEIGHIAHGVITKSNRNYEYSWQAILDWNNNDTPKRIVADAWQTIKGKYEKGTKIRNAKLKISEYALADAAETVAEAFSDVYSNGAKAQPLSIEIVRILGEELK